MDDPNVPNFLERIAATNSAEQLLSKYAIVCEALNLAAAKILRDVGQGDTPAAPEVTELVNELLEHAQQRLTLAFHPTPQHPN